MIIGILSLLFACTGTESTDTASQTELISAFADAGEDVSVILGAAAQFTSPNSTGIYLSWNFGDGETAAGESVEHLFEEVGRYQVVLTAIGSDGNKDADAISVTVHHPILEEVSLSSSTMILDQDTLWLITEEAGTLSRINIQTQELEVFEICSKPKSLAIQDSIIGITCSTEATLAFFNTESTEITFLDLPENSQPHGIVGRDGVWWIALSATGELAELYTELRIYPIGTDLRGVALSPDGRIIFPRWRSSTSGAEIYIWDGQAVETIVLDIDTAGDSDNTTGGLPNLLENVYPSLDGTEFLIPFSHANIIRGELLNGQALGHETSLRGILSTIQIGQQEIPSTRKHFDERGRASALAFSPLGDILYVLHPSTGTVTILDAYNKQIMGSILELGNMPTALQISEDGLTLFVNLWLDREVVAFDVSSPAQVQELWRSGILEEEPLDPEILLGKQLFYTAADTRITRSGYISCGNCHPDGSHDGQTWDFTDRGEGLRNTTSLLGREGTAMGRLHWSGNFDEVQDFENDIRNAFAGTGLLSDQDWEATSATLGTAKAGLSEDLDALAEYVTSLTETPPSPYPIDSAGEDAFYMVGCAECHPAPLYTDSDTMLSLRHNVGSLLDSSGGRLGGELDGLDTPTLLGLWRTAPYLHDGRTDSISEAITAHTDYEDLSPELLYSIEMFLFGL